MKKLITLLLIMLFGVQPMTFAYNEKVDEVETNVQKNDFQIKQIKTDAFEKNYQKEIESVKPQMSQIEQLFNGKETSATGQILKQAGYDLFSAATTSSSQVGKYDDS